MLTNLVIGSDGFVGRPFCDYLESIGEKVVRFDIKRSVDEDARVAVLDLSEMDRIYFLAWDVGGAKYLYRDDAQFRQLDWNLSLMLNLMPQLQKASKPFLFVSSQLAEETDSVYGVTKRLGEVWTKLLGGVRVRLWNVYGAVENVSDRSHVVADFLYQAKKYGEIKMLTSGDEMRQFIHISDVCHALHSALSQQIQGIYDVTSFEWVRVRDVGEIIAKLTNSKLILGKLEGSTPRTPIMGKIPNWKPKVELIQGLSMMVKASD
jgi:nucleoside-diphosphate-sugar epimerase